jgi:hypothetical protein
MLPNWYFIKSFSIFVIQNPIRMKNLQTVMAVLFLGVTAFFTSCSPDYDYASTTTTQELLTRNAWEVDHFSRSAQNVTGEYSNNTFFFSNNGTVSCRKENVQCNGTWSLGINSNNAEVITILMNSSDTRITQLNQNWELTGRSLSNIQLQQNDATGTNQLLIKVKK